MTLGNKDVVPHLVTLLGQPDPLVPETLPNGTRVVARELIRVNHLANCLMCHPPSYDGGGPVLGAEPRTQPAATAVSETLTARPGSPAT